MRDVTSEETMFPNESFTSIADDNNIKDYICDE